MLRLRALRTFFLVSGVAFSVAGCSNAPLAPLSDGHLRGEKVSPIDTASIPAPVRQMLIPPPPQPTPKAETYSVVVHNVDLDELLFALAREAKINVDIHPAIRQMNQKISMNAIDQTLPQLLDRLCRQTDLRWEMHGNNLSIMPDTPYLRTYRVDYVNMARTMSGKVSIETQIPTTGGGPTLRGSSGNIANTTIETQATNAMMHSLVANIEAILRETDKYIPKNAQTASLISNAAAQYRAQAEAQGEGRVALSGPASAPAGSAKPGQQGNFGTSVSGGLSGAGEQRVEGQSQATQNRATDSSQVDLEYREAASVIANYETGVLTVRATRKQHEKIQEFLDQVLLAAKRQVLIEATIVEVRLNDNYQQGIEWSRLSLSGLGLRLTQKTLGTPGSLMEIGYTNPDFPLGNLSATIKLLESFGTVKVLSSPKLSVLNNQTAMLKVVDNHVYFLLDAKVTPGQSGGAPIVAYTTTPQTVSVGLVMTVTPQIADNDIVTLNLRPTISRITSWKLDPNPELKRAEATNLVPEIQTREMESVIRIRSGEIAVLGGLMEDALSNESQTVPGIAQLPIVGNLFQQRNDTRRKTELVIFLRPVIVRDASVQGDLADYRHFLPEQNAFEKANNGPPRQVFDFSRNGP